MYSIYLKPTTSYNSMSLNDYIQLQHARAKEQQRMEELRRIEQEELRIQNALRNLKAIRELKIQREREQRAIQAYYQKLAYLHEQEQIRQERERQYYQDYVNALQNHYRASQPVTKATMFCHPSDALASCSAPVHDEHVSDSDSETEEEEEEDQFPQIINVLFGGASQEQGESSKKPEKEAAANKKKEDTTRNIIQQEQRHSDEMNIDQFMNYFNDKLQKFNETYEDSENNARLQSQDVTEEHEPNLVPLLQDEDQAMEEAEDLDSIAVQHIELSQEVPVTQENNLLPTHHEPASFEQQSETLTSLVNEPSLPDNDSQRYSPFSDEDPIKLAKYNALSSIEQELVEIQLKNASILQNSLEFDLHSEDAENLPANTANNREFLGYEDQLVKIMLKLDMIESDGDEDIRAERKSLIKRAESILEALDDFKHREWERVSNSSQSGSDDEYVIA